MVPKRMMVYGPLIPGSEGIGSLICPRTPFRDAATTVHGAGFEDFPADGGIRIVAKGSGDRVTAAEAARRSPGSLEDETKPSGAEGK